MSSNVPSKSQLKQSLLQALDSELLDAGFTLKKSHDRFVRRHDGVQDLFQLVCLDGKPGLRVQPNVGVRIDRVEEIFHRTSGFEPRYQADTPTIGSSIGTITADNNRACEWLVETEADALKAAAEIGRLFKSFAEPYFDRFNSVARIDDELNRSPDTRTPHRVDPWLRCSTGTIVAKLASRPNYDGVVEVYLQTMRTSDAGFYLKSFEALVESLKAVAPE